MWDAVRFAEYHRYTAITQNVVDAAKWILWPAWRASLEALGYHCHVVYLNSMHAQAGGMPAPRSRDGIYVVYLGTFGAHGPVLGCWNSSIVRVPGVSRQLSMRMS
jgi:DNA (cytosine-5)-methyltransferase 1